MKLNILIGRDFMESESQQVMCFSVTPATYKSYFCARLHVSKEKPLDIQCEVSLIQAGSCMYSVIIPSISYLYEGTLKAAPSTGTEYTGQWYTTSWLNDSFQAK